MNHGKLLILLLFLFHLPTSPSKTLVFRKTFQYYTKGCYCILHRVMLKLGSVLCYGGTNH
uniref:Uncharacterized protein n=1 Tax=Meloidogyne enterolobii TaxID=390850 RepID=A0A6V7XFZ3_MELEN|nr:unnamed protein product [Meloidogyne enterolobii]